MAILRVAVVNCLFPFHLQLYLILQCLSISCAVHHSDLCLIYVHRELRPKLWISLCKRKISASTVLICESRSVFSKHHFNALFLFEFLFIALHCVCVWACFSRYSYVWSLITPLLIFFILCFSLRNHFIF